MLSPQNREPWPPEPCGQCSTVLPGKWPPTLISETPGSTSSWSPAAQPVLEVLKQPSAGLSHYTGSGTKTCYQATAVQGGQCCPGSGPSL